MSAVSASSSFDMLYESHGDWLRGWLRGHTRCSHRAADLAHDTFCRLLEATDTPVLRDARSYLATVARRILIDDIRRREVERAYLEVQAAQNGDADYLTPERIVGASQLLVAVLSLLDTVPMKARDAFMMIRFDGFRYSQAADRLGVSERMVKRYVAQVYRHCYAVAYPEE